MPEGRRPFDTTTDAVRGGKRETERVRKPARPAAEPAQSAGHIDSRPIASPAPRTAQVAGSSAIRATSPVSS